MAVGPEELGEHLREINPLVVRMLQESEVLLHETNKLIGDGHIPEDIGDITAALSTVHHFTQASLGIILQGRERIFTTNGHGEEIPEVHMVLAPAIDLIPTTFAELLRQRIENYFPRDRTVIPADEIHEFAGNSPRVKGAMLKAIRTAGVETKRNYPRDEAVRSVHAYLRSSSGKLSLKEAYNRTSLLQTFQFLKAALLDELGREIGWDWHEKPIVDGPTALELRGLGYWEEIMAEKNRQP